MCVYPSLICTSNYVANCLKEAGGLVHTGMAHILLAIILSTGNLKIFIINVDSVNRFGLI